MTPEARAHLKQLMEGQRVLSLAVLVNGEPHLGLLPYAIQPGHSALLVHASSLARHTEGLHSPGKIAVLIHQSEEAVGNPLQVPRVSFHGNAAVLERESPEYEAAKTCYLERFPDSAVTFELGDFQLFELKLFGGRYVEGFASASNVTLDDLAAL